MESRNISTCIRNQHVVPQQVLKWTRPHGLYIIYSRVLQYPSVSQNSTRPCGSLSIFPAKKYEHFITFHFIVYYSEPCMSLVNWINMNINLTSFIMHIFLCDRNRE